MPRSFCIPGIFFIFCAFVLLFLVSISLPFLTALDIVRTSFDSGVALDDDSIRQLRLGIWAACSYSEDDDARTCSDAHTAYSVGISAPNNQGGITIGPSWTRGLAIHPVATAVTFIALLFSFSTHLTVTLVASLLSFLAAIITLIAFAVDIALYVKVHHDMKSLPDVTENTDTGPGFWMTFVSLILLLLAGCTVCLGRRRDRMSGTSNSYPMMSNKTSFWSRFRRN